MKKISLLVLLGGVIISGGIMTNVVKADFVDSYLSGPLGWGTNEYGDPDTTQIIFRALSVFMKIDYRANAVVQTTNQVLNPGDNVTVGSRITFSGTGFQNGPANDLTWQGRITYAIRGAAGVGSASQNTVWKSGYFGRNYLSTYRACNLADLVYPCEIGGYCPAIIDQYVYPFMDFYENGKYLTNQIPRVDVSAAVASGVLSNCTAPGASVTCDVAKPGNIQVSVIYKPLKVKLGGTNTVELVGLSSQEKIACEWSPYYPKAVSSPEVDELLPPAKTVVINLVAQAPLPAKPACYGADIVVPKNSTGQSITLSCSGVIDSRAVVAQPQHGTLGVINQTNGTVTYKPTADYTGTDSFTFKATNAGGDSDLATINITIPTPPPVGEPPVCNNGSVSVPKDSDGQSIDLSCSGGVISIKTPPVAPNGGTVGLVNQTNKTVVYKPKAGYAGSDSFTFGSTDANGDSNVATINVTVVAPPPVVVIPKPTVSGPQTATAEEAELMGLTFTAVSGAVGNLPDGRTREYRYGFDWDNDMDEANASWSSPPVTEGQAGAGTYSGWINAGEYKFRVITVDNNGNKSAWSDEFTVKITETPPGICTDPTITYWGGCPVSCGGGTEVEWKYEGCVSTRTGNTRQCNVQACDSDIIEVPVGP